MSTAKALVDENNRTLAFIEAKDYYSAVQSSSSAVSNLQKVRFTEESCSETTSATTLDQCMMLACKESSNEFRSDDTQQPFIFDQGIFLPSTVTDWRVITPALIFNSALARHLLPGDDETPSTILPRLHKAKQLYELAYGVGQTGSHNTLFRFSVINNIAVIDRQIGNLEQSERNFEGLMSTYMMLVDQGSTEQLRYLQGFLSNISKDNHNDVSAAA